MKVFLAGATGVLGRRILAAFRAAGHEVIALYRDRRGEELIKGLGAKGQQADLFDPDALCRAAEGAEVVIHAATAIPTTRRTMLADWEMNDRIRRQGTRALTTCAARIGARLYLQQSVIWVATPADGAAFDEDSPPCPAPVMVSAADAEAICREATARHGLPCAVLRCGWFYGADAAHTRMIGEGLSRRRLPIGGKGDAVWSVVHLSDAATAFLRAAEARRPALWHVVDDRRVTAAEFLQTFAGKLGAPPPRHVPLWLVRLAAGKSATEFFTTSVRTSNARLRADLGWEPRYPTIEEGLAQIVADWRADKSLGWLPPGPG